MKLQFGSHTHAINEAAVSISRRSNFNDHGVPISVTEMWDIQGILMSDTQANLTTAINDLISAYATDGADLKLLFDDDSPSSHQLLTASCYGGTRVTTRPEFPEGRGAEYSLYRNYRIVVEGEVLDAAGAGDVVEWDETISFSGGGPEFVFLKPINGLPIKQLIRANTPYVATQQGSAVGRDSYPTPPLPLWSSAEHVDKRQITRGTPKKMGRDTTTTYKMYPVQWSYSFESDSLLIGSPSLWPSGS